MEGVLLVQKAKDSRTD